MNTEDLKEEWREYNGYKISNYGKVIGLKGKLLSTKPAKDGYITTSIKGLNGKTIHGMHRIVATVFLPNPNNLPEVNHIDGKKENNKVNNLEWCTKKYNQGHASYTLGKRIGSDCYKHKLTEEEVLEIYELCKEGKLTYKEIGSDYGVSEYSISYIALGKSWKHLKLKPIKVVRGSRKYQYMNSKTKPICT